MAANIIAMRTIKNIMKSKLYRLQKTGPHQLTETYHPVNKICSWNNRMVNIKYISVDETEENVHRRKAQKPHLNAVSVSVFLACK